MRAQVASLLDRAARIERRRAVAWPLAGLVTAAGAFLLGLPVGGALSVGSFEGALVGVIMGVMLGLWSVRQEVGIHLALRDFRRADTSPRRAYVALLHDPSPQAYRPLLAVWPRAPAAEGRVPRPESVWRCDDELAELGSTQSSVVVHEAWVDTGPRPSSKPRWVRADAGIAVPHRRSLFGRRYVAALLRSARLGELRRLTVEDPRAGGDTGRELPLEYSVVRAVGGRVVPLGAFAAAVVFLA